MYTGLRLVTPPAAEPITVDQLRRHARIDTAEFDDLLAVYISTARTLAEQFLGRALYTQTLAWTMSQVPPSGALPLLPMPLLVLPVILSFPQIWNRPFDLPRAPVQSVSSVVVTYQDGTTATLDPAADYSVDLGVDPARLRLGSLNLPVYARELTVTFVAGYGAPPGTGAASPIPAPILTGILFLATWLWEHRGDTGDDLPLTAQALMAPYRLAVFGG